MPNADGKEASVKDVQTFRGIVHGQTIQFGAELGIPDGQEVVVSIALPQGDTTHLAGDGIRLSAGGWNDDVAGLDKFLEEVYSLRHFAMIPNARIEDWLAP
jgi:hypothetical protein